MRAPIVIHESRRLLIFRHSSNKLTASPGTQEGLASPRNGMNRNWFNLLLIWSVAVLAPGCGTGQRLVGITVTPAAVVFGAADPALFVQLTATGTYIHPPATKDITNQVTWTSDTVEVAQVVSGGKVTPSQGCGVAGITASLLTNHPSGNLITGTTTVTVDGTTPGCPNITP
jgi:hypothetical protein